MNIQECLNKFFGQINSLTFYNEIGLQLELAIFLRQNGFKVFLEVPIECVSETVNVEETKKELDILVECPKTDSKYVIELKMPKSKYGVPKEMFEVIRDVKSIEALKIDKAIVGGFAILLTDNCLFWKFRRNQLGIYGKFRGDNVTISTLSEHEVPQFLRTRPAIDLCGTYSASWMESVKGKFYVLEI